MGPSRDVHTTLTYDTDSGLWIVAVFIDGSHDFDGAGPSPEVALFNAVQGLAEHVAGLS